MEYQFYHGKYMFLIFLYKLNLFLMSVTITHSMVVSWYLYQTVTNNMLRTNVGKQCFSDNKYLIFDCSQTNPKPYTGQITEIAPHVRIYIRVTIQYKYHGYYCSLAHFVLILYHHKLLIKLNNKKSSENLCRSSPR